MKGLKPSRVRTIKWLDHSSTSNWQSLEDVKKWVAETKAKPCLTRGEVVYEDKDVMVLTDGNDGNGNYGNCTLIWRRLIVKK